MTRKKPLIGALTPCLPNLLDNQLSIGAGDGNRTHDMQLGKLPFYH
jgi:hypothetical protein